MIPRPSATSTQIVRCKCCKTPIIRLGPRQSGQVLQATISGWELHDGDLRIVIRCASCDQRRRFRIYDVYH